MTNTPLMQLVLMHRNYWYRVRGLKDTVPRLGICVINFHPKRQAEIPTDRDGVLNRNSSRCIVTHLNEFEEIIKILEQINTGDIQYKPASNERISEFLEKHKLIGMSKVEW